MYRVRFDYLDIIVGNATDPTTMTYFSSLLKRAAPKGKIKSFLICIVDDIYKCMRILRKL